MTPVLARATARASNTIEGQTATGSPRRTFDTWAKGERSYTQPGTIEVQPLQELRPERPIETTSQPDERVDHFAAGEVRPQCHFPGNECDPRLSFNRR